MPQGVLCHNNKNTKEIIPVGHFQGMVEGQALSCGFRNFRFSPWLRHECVRMPVLSHLLSLIGALSVHLDLIWLTQDHELIQEQKYFQNLKKCFFLHKDKSAD